jgi:hypothetical protein
MTSSRYGHKTITFMFGCMLMIGFGLSPKSASGSATVLVEQPYGKLNIFDPGGHSAIYLDRVCAETPLKLRPCGAGELGTVISRYDGISNHDWIAIPLLPYLYAVESSEDIPQTMDKALEDQMRDAYRRK